MNVPASGTRPTSSAPPMHANPFVSPLSSERESLARQGFALGPLSADELASPVPLSGDRAGSAIALALIEAASSGSVPDALFEQAAHAASRCESPSLDFFMQWLNAAIGIAAEQGADPKLIRCGLFEAGLALLDRQWIALNANNTGDECDGPAPAWEAGFEVFDIGLLDLDARARSQAAKALLESLLLSRAIAPPPRKGRPLKA